MYLIQHFINFYTLSRWHYLVLTSIIKFTKLMFFFLSINLVVHSYVTPLLVIIEPFFFFTSLISIFSVILKSVYKYLILTHVLNNRHAIFYHFLHIANPCREVMVL